MEATRSNSSRKGDTEHNNEPHPLATGTGRRVILTMVVVVIRSKVRGMKRPLTRVRDWDVGVQGDTSQYGSVQRASYPALWYFSTFVQPKRKGAERRLAGREGSRIGGGCFLPYGHEARSRRRVALIISFFFSSSQYASTHLICSPNAGRPDAMEGYEA